MTSDPRQNPEESPMTDLRKLASEATDLLRRVRGGDVSADLRNASKSLGQGYDQDWISRLLEAPAALLDEITRLRSELDAARAEVERLKAPPKEKRAPVQGWPGGIPWHMHLRAYEAYSKKWSPQPALVDLEGRGCRGGFSTGELDGFIPGWRDELSGLAELRAQADRSAKMAKALQPLVEFRRRVKDSLGEAVHTGLRKGVDGKGSGEAWRAIHDMTDGGWSEAVAFAIYGLEYGLERELAEADSIARAALGEERAT